MDQFQVAQQQDGLWAVINTQSAFGYWAVIAACKVRADAEAIAAALNA